MARTILFLVAVSLAFPGRTSADVTIGGARPTVLHVPASYDPSVPTPLFFFLHGYSGSGADQESYWRHGPLAEEYTFLYVNPDGTMDGQGFRFWDSYDACCNFTGRPVDDSGYLRGLVEEVEAQFNVDRDRIYFAGGSNGGLMAYRMACDHADKVAAIASMAGTTNPDPARCNPVGPVHVLEVHGTADDTTLYDGGTFQGTDYFGSVATVEQWAAKNGCTLSADTSGPPLDLDSSIPGDETTVAKYTNGCREGGSAELWTIQGGGHIPSLITSGDTTTFARLMVEWLLAHPKSPGPVDGPKYRRGDTNSDGTHDLSDAIDALGFLFLGQPRELACPKSADFNDDGGIDISDPVSLLGYLFLAAPAVPPEPFAACGVDPTVDGLGCETNPCRA